VRCSFPLGIHARIPPTRGCRFPGHSSRDFSLPARHDRERKGGMSTAGRSASSRDRLLSHFRPSSSAIQTEREQDLPPGGGGGGFERSLRSSGFVHTALRPPARPPASKHIDACVANPRPGIHQRPARGKKKGGVFGQSTGGGIAATVAGSQRAQPASKQPPARGHETAALTHTHTLRTHRPSKPRSAPAPIRSRRMEGGREGTVVYVLHMCPCVCMQPSYICSQQYIRDSPLPPGPHGVRTYIECIRWISI